MMCSAGAVLMLTNRVLCRAAASGAAYVGVSPCRGRCRRHRRSLREQQKTPPNTICQLHVSPAYVLVHCGAVQRPC